MKAGTLKTIGSYAFAVCIVALYFYALAHDIYTRSFGHLAFDAVFPPAGVVHALLLL
ncbi:hypothetical protein [Paraburkholderia tuberum]|uniref:Uncharacterized protein n=1 Tax=Paraburkholderia tuberum TaxID=157910 RepID=A0A1H1JBX7_9BURK|nr:hypothetical protein [Paraburkholderia tuberum]SDR46948.1 hypothetical protein SAMN05445850_4487 [Paraburkholderia tuberum]